jgi:F-type H+-transporting ATPase subunit epsilon
MLLEIISPEKKLYAGEAEAILLPGMAGDFGTLKDHAPMVSTLRKGKIKITEPGKKELFFSIAGGVVEVLKNKIIVLVEAD